MFGKLMCGCERQKSISICPLLNHNRLSINNYHPPKGKLASRYVLPNNQIRIIIKRFAYLNIRFIYSLFELGEKN